MYSELNLKKKGAPEVIRIRTIHSIGCAVLNDDVGRNKSSMRMEDYYSAEMFRQN